VEAEKMKKIMERRRVIKPRSRDYEEAHAKLEMGRSGQGSRSAEEAESRNIEQAVDMVLLDWDGVMYDSTDHLGQAVVEVTKHFGKEWDVARFKESYDAPFWDYYESLGVPATTEEEQQYIYRIYHDTILPRLVEGGVSSDMYPEVWDTLRELKERGLRVGIVSAHKPAEIERVLEEKRARDFIDFIVGLAHNKTEAIRQICEQNRLDPKRVLMFGDLPSDLRDAKAAGIKTAAVARFEAAKDRLGSYDPDFLFQTLGPEIFHLRPYQDSTEETQQ